MLDRLSDSILRTIAVWKMEGYTTEEIATKLGCVPRTVERKLQVIRRLWGDEGMRTVILDDRSDREFAALSAVKARQADQVCDCFEATWRTGQRPRIEDFLDDVSEPSRTILLRELIALDAAYRRLRGESPRLSEYRTRFPDRESSWLVAPWTALAEPATRALTSGPIRTLSPRRRTRRLGKFELIERVGAGAFGSVWRARDLQLGRVVAVKVPHAELVDSPKDLERIYREARTVAQLRHPGVVSVHEVFVHEGLPILVSDFVVGTTLGDLLATRRLSHREAATLVSKVAEALAYAHALGAIHRDIKPANIMVDRESAGTGSERPPPAKRQRRPRTPWANRESSTSGWRSATRMASIRRSAASSSAPRLT